MSESQQHPDLDELQDAYKAALEQWIAAIRAEEALVCVNHTVAQVDRWEKAHFDEEDARDRAKDAKQTYEDALREKFFGF
jgi:predicted RNase H-like HicB family nuclease